MVGELGIAIVDQVSLVAEETVLTVHEIAGHLRHERGVWVRRDACDLDLPAGQLDHEEDVVSDQASPSPKVDGEEVSGTEDIPMRAKEVSPGGLLASLAGGLESMLLQDVGDRRSSDGVAQVAQGTDDLGIPPPRILPSHGNDQIANGLPSERALFVGVETMQPNSAYCCVELKV